MFPLFNVVDDLLPTEEPEHHPWEKLIKDAYANKIKTAHNSINNPRYPKKKERDTENPIKKVKFTVIGNRVTKEFIYCINIVKGLHKYRKKCFEPPVIRGVTSVDWPNVWNDIKIQYGGIAYCLKSQVVVFLDDKIVGGENELKELISEKYTYYLCLDYYHESVKQFANFIKGSGLYADVVPYTCENFLRLCKATKGGYSGTPVHRIVEDGWIQCGGYGLKETKLDCENFIVPPDKRGVLCMANAGRHIDCSTQFFVLLQPSPWMLHKYVAFGQLIDGDATLRKIENVATWYESPQQNISIYQAGIMNMDCKDTMVNQSAHEYLHGHIEDLFALAEVLWEEIIARVFLQLQIKENELLEAMEDEEEPAGKELNLHATARFMKKGTAPGKSQKSKSQDEPKPSQAQIRSRSQSRPLDGSKSVVEAENNDFDVSEYQYEAEEYIYEKQSLIEVKESESLVVKPEKPYYIEFTDVPYPGEVSSEYNLKKVLLGDYCLEADVVPPVDPPKVATHCLHKIETFPAEFFEVSSQESSSSELSLDSQDEAEIKVFLENYTDSSSFAGELVRGIAHAKHVMDSEKANLTDDQLRQMRLLQKRLQKTSEEEHNRKVNIAVPSVNRLPKQIKRRQTGFVKPKSLTQESEVDDDVEKSVRIDPGAILNWAPSPKIMRRNTEYERPRFFDSEVDVHHWKDKPSALARLFKQGETPSTLKEFGLTTVVEERSMMLKSSRINGSLDTLEHYRKLSNEDNVPHPRKPRTSFESMKTSLRSVAFAKTRPCITVEEYQLKNKQYKEEMENKGGA